MSVAVWFTGLSGAGKTTICAAVAAQLRSRGIAVQVLDGDEVRKGLCSDLGFTVEDRMENIRRIAWVADLLVRNGTTALVATISPLNVMREVARKKLGGMLEVFVDAPVEICEARDPKGLYRKARAGLLTDFTGISAVYEPPLSPDVVCHTDLESIDESAEKVLWAALLRMHDTNPYNHCTDVNQRLREVTGRRP
jgi:adenylylsulfate kinase